MERPVVELDKCIVCEICIDLCPDVFIMNDLGYVDIIDMKKYPTDEIHEAIINCPADCISMTNENTL